MKTRYWFIAIVAIIFTCIAPCIFTSPTCFECLDFTDTGQIGDTIGGITAPIIGIVSIIFLVLTLQAQLDFNKKQARDNALSQIHTLQSQIIQLDERFLFHFANNIEGRICQLTGISSLKILEKWNGNNVSINVFQANAILGQLETFIALCNCYKERLNETIFNVAPYNDFIDGYRQQIRHFLNAVINKYVVIIDNSANSYHNDLDKSEIDEVRDKAKDLLEKL